MAKCVEAAPEAKNICTRRAPHPAPARPPIAVSEGYARVGAPGVAGSGARVAEVGTGPGSGAEDAFKMLIRKGRETDGSSIGRPRGS